MSIDLSTLDQLGAELEAAAQAGLEDAAQAALAVAQGLTSGALAKSITLSQDGDGWTLQTDAPYATFVENGRAAVQAQHAKVLRFVINGTVMFRKNVGPAAAKPFMKPAGEWLEFNAASYVEQAMGGV